MKLEERVNNLIFNQFDLILKKTQENLYELGYDFIDLNKIKNFLIRRIQEEIYNHYEEKTVKDSIKLGKDSNSSPIFIGKIYLYYVLLEILDEMKKNIDKEIKNEAGKIISWSFRNYGKKLMLDIKSLLLVPEDEFEKNQDLLLKEEAEKILKVIKELLIKSDEELNILLRNFDESEKADSINMFYKDLVLTILEKKEYRELIEAILKNNNINELEEILNSEEIKQDKFSKPLQFLIALRLRTLK